MFKKSLQKGFTLIELMVVVSIIGVLMAAGILAFTNAQQSARDSKRKADMDAISKAQEQYAAQNNSYPVAANITSAILTYFPNGLIPTDPKNSGASVYTVTGNTGSTFCSCALLEKVGTGNATTVGAGGVCAYAAAGGNYFCTSQRQ